MVPAYHLFPPSAGSLAIEPAGAGDRPFGLGPSVLVRSAAALVGVGLGLSVAVGVARQLHTALVGSVDQTIALERASRAVGVAFGTAGAGFLHPAEATGTLGGTAAEAIAAAAGLAPVAAQFNLTTVQVSQLITVERTLARIHGVELPAAGQILQSVLRGQVDAGQASICNSPTNTADRGNVGLSFEELTAAVGPIAARQQLLAAIVADTSRQFTNHVRYSRRHDQSTRTIVRSVGQPA